MILYLPFKYKAGQNRPHIYGNGQGTLEQESFCVSSNDPEHACAWLGYHSVNFISLANRVRDHPSAVQPERHNNLLVSVQIARSVLCLCPAGVVLNDLAVSDVTSKTHRCIMSVGGRVERALFASPTSPYFPPYPPMRGLIMLHFTFVHGRAAER